MHECSAAMHKSCHGTGRDITERKSSKTNEKNPSVMYPGNPVDNHVGGPWREGPELPWLTADEWFWDFINKLQSHAGRRRTMMRRETAPIPVKDTLARDYQEKTEQLLRYLRGQRKASQRLVTFALSHATKERKVS